MGDFQKFVLPVGRLVEAFAPLPPAPAPTITCSRCLSTVPAAACRCAYCSGPQPAAPGT